MKKPLTIAIGLFALAAFTAVSPAQEKRATPPKAVEEEPNTLTLSLDNMVKLPDGNCIVSAWLSNSAKPGHIYTGSRVTFTVTAGIVTRPCTIDAKNNCHAEVLNGATIYGTSHGIRSNNIVCPKKGS